jgi:hypothetical protein
VCPEAVSGIRLADYGEYDMRKRTDEQVALMLCIPVEKMRNRRYW